MSEPYRVGHHQPQNVYRGDAYIGVMFSPEDAALAVSALNGAPHLGPDRIRDIDGDWFTRQQDGTYRMDRGGGAVWQRSEIVTTEDEVKA
ncbi:MAG: hypothetical protein ACEQSX_20470 [Baekduiaceae bacterium]